MRKIEKQMLAAIRNGDTFDKGNTRLHHTTHSNFASFDTDVFLHGHCIAKIGRDANKEIMDVYVSLAGWNTRTTRSRINAIITNLVDSADGVFTRNGQAYLRVEGIKYEIDDNEFHAVL